MPKSHIRSPTISTTAQVSEIIFAHFYNLLVFSYDILFMFRLKHSQLSPRLQLAPQL